MQNTTRISEHDRRAEFLRTLAELAGYHVKLRCLPDGLLPDVLQFSPTTDGLFVGDAKNKEGPFDRQTQVRLLRYLRSIKIYLRKPNAHALFAICFGNPRQDASWERVIAMLTSEAGIYNSTIRIDAFDRNHLVWHLTWHSSGTLATTCAQSSGSCIASSEVG